MGRKVWLFITLNPLNFRAFCVALLSIFFQIYLKQFFVPTRYGFVQNFKRYLLITRSVSIKRIIENTLVYLWYNSHLFTTRNGWERLKTKWIFLILIRITPIWLYTCCIVWNHSEIKVIRHHSTLNKTFITTYPMKSLHWSHKPRMSFRRSLKSLLYIG
jgi:hypothetical protein